jgi:hypothetical protein
MNDGDIFFNLLSKTKTPASFCNVMVRQTCYSVGAFLGNQQVLHIVNIQHIDDFNHIVHIVHIQEFDKMTNEPHPSCHCCYTRTELPSAPKSMNTRQGGVYLPAWDI